MASQPHKLLLRLPDRLHGRVLEASKRYRRSMNSEIVTRLEHSLNGLSGDESESSVEPPFFAQIEATLRGGLTEEEDSLVRLYRRLSVRQRAALLTLLEG